MFQSLLTPIRSRFDLSPRSATFDLPPNSPNGNPVSPPPRSPFGLTSPPLRSPFGSIHAGVLEGMPTEDDLDPEEFARDVIIELMRKAVDGLKEVQIPGEDGVGDGKRGRVDILNEILRIMLQDSCTKDVFREMDGFLGLMSILSIMSISNSSSTLSSTNGSTAVSTPTPIFILHQDDPLAELFEVLRLVFEILSEATKEHEPNAEWFRTNVRYETFTHALRAILVSATDPDTKTRLSNHILSLLLSLSLSNFSPLNTQFFDRVRTKEDSEGLDAVVKSVVGIIGKDKNKDATKGEEKKGRIERPEAVGVLWALGVEVTNQNGGESDMGSSMTRYGLFKLFEALFHVSHRNAAVLASLGIVGGVWKAFQAIRDYGLKIKRDKGKTGDSWKEKEKLVLQRLLKRMLEIGATTSEARDIFQRAAMAPPSAGSEGSFVGVQSPGGHKEAVPRQDHPGLDGEVLDIIRHGMKSRWVEHFSMEGSKAALVLRDNVQAGRGHKSAGLKGIVGAGWTFMTWFWIADLPRVNNQPQPGPNQDETDENDNSYALFTIDTPVRMLLRFGLRQDGKLELSSSSPPTPPATPFSPSSGSMNSTWHRLSASIASPPAFLTSPTSGSTFLGPQSTHRSFSSGSLNVQDFKSPTSSGSRTSFFNDGRPAENKVLLEKANIREGRWTHVALIHCPATGRSTGSIKVFIDGLLNDMVPWSFPKLNGGSLGRYMIGNLSGKVNMSWCLASAYMFGVALPDELPRLIHHLSPGYTGDFLDPELVKFLTYEAATSLNIYVNSVASLRPPTSAVAFTGAAKSRASSTKDSTKTLVKAFREGTGITNSMVVFSLAAASAQESGFNIPVTVRGIGSTALGSSLSAAGSNVTSAYMGGNDGQKGMVLELEGDVFVVKVETLDGSMWKIGGAAVGLRLVQLAGTAHELSRALGILTDGLKNSWQNSEDMERLRGYEILADMLRSKAQHINLTSFETLFEFLGVNFTTPEQSTITNAIAYRALALDFSLWSRTHKQIQQAHFDHFDTLLVRSRLKSFNIKQRLAKLGLVRKVLFALQADWYCRPHAPHDGEQDNNNRDEQEIWKGLIGVLKIVATSNWDRENTLKPLSSFLAANLHEVTNGDGSPHSMRSQFEIGVSAREKAEEVLKMLVQQVLSQSVYYTQFSQALPLTRILLLFLGEHPSSAVATQVLNLIGISIKVSSSFSRKFELISGWGVLKIVLPGAWDPQVNRAAFDLLLGKSIIAGGTENATPTPTSAKAKQKKEYRSTMVSCTHILPTIISALQIGLVAVVANCGVDDSDEDATHLSWSTETTMEILIEELISLHASSSTFRQIFESQQTTQLFIDTYKTMVAKLASATRINGWNIRILEKLTHFGLALALDNAVAGGQKREILNNIQSAEATLNPGSRDERMCIDPGLVVDNRSVRQRIASARFSMQVGERTVIKTITRTSEWRGTVQVSERKRQRKTVLDIREHRRQISRLQEWKYLLTSERGLWPCHELRLWRLDETEGPYRIRKKLEPQNDDRPSSRVDGLEEITRDVHVPDTESSSVIHVEVPPWAESYEIASTEMDERQQLTDDVIDDKLRRVRHELEPGDVIEAVATVARIDGVDSSPGLLILGRTHIYMLDGVVENDQGEVIDAHDAPKRLLFIPGSIVELDGPQKAQRWSHSQIATCGDKKFLFRDVALEIYFKDSRSLLIVFLAKKQRSDFEHRLWIIIGRPCAESAVTPGPVALRTPLFGKVGSRMLSGFKSDELSTATRKWQARETSNFAYLSILNQISGRTPSDATQYPVFPWVLSDYTSQTLDLSNPRSYRDLAKPMGALTPARRQAAETRYENLQSVGEDPFHYGTHFSSSMIVCHFLIRIAPFTNMFKTLQGGDWDLPDRLFSDLPRAYDSAASDVRGDVRELIPEFFTCPEFLENSANHDFGVLQQTGERIHDVKLPPWARHDPLLFIAMNRRALESPLVSEQLPAWIDLIWGCKQRDPASLNVFHPLSYEGSIDLDAIKDDLEREATVGIIHNFGQTPRKLFQTPHPERYHHGLPNLPIGTLHGIEENPHMLVQAPRCFRDLGPTVPVREFIPDLYSEKMIPCAEGMLCLPQYPHEFIEWSTGSAELRVIVDHKVVQALENAFCNCASFADSNCLVTGSSDYTVRLWKVSRGPHANSSMSGMRVALSHIMRVHTAEVISVAASRLWSLVVSGSKDGSAALWDLNRGVYVRSIWHGEGEANAVNLVAINESTGYIATCSRLKLCLHTVNARPIATLDLTTTSSFSSLVPTVTSMAFHEREYSHLGVLATGGPDGSITLRTWTADGTPEGEKAQWEFLTIRSMKARIGHGMGRPPSVTALKFLGECLYHGEETGKSFIWTLSDP